MSATRTAARPGEASRRLLALQCGLVLGGEASWLFAWSVGLGDWLGAAAGPLLEPLPLVGLLVAATAATRLVSARLADRRLARLALGLLGLGLALLVSAAGGGIDPTADPSATWTRLRYTSDGARAVAALALGLLAWWRGIVAGRARPAPDTVEAALRVAVAGLAALLLLRSFAPPPASERSAIALLGSALLVLTSGLLGLPLANVVDLGRARAAGADSTPRISRYWLGMLVGGVALLLVAVLFLVSAPTFEWLDRLWQLLVRPLYAVFRLAISILAIPAGLLAGAILWLRGLLPDVSVWWLEPPTPPDLTWLDQLWALASEPPEAPELLSPGVAAALFATLGVLAVWAFANAIVRLGDSSRGDGVEELRDFVWTRPTLRDSLRRAFRSPFNRRQASSILDPAAPGSGAAVREARALYRQFLSLGARLGRPRAPAETPREYERALASGPFRIRSDDVGTLTTVYVQARYGAEPPSGPSVEAARAALTRLSDGAG
jgi:hypothetical protein